MFLIASWERCQVGSPQCVSQVDGTLDIGTHKAKLPQIYVSVHDIMLMILMLYYLSDCS